MSYLGPIKSELVCHLEIWRNVVSVLLLTVRVQTANNLIDFDILIASINVLSYLLQVMSLLMIHTVTTSLAKDSHDTYPTLI